MTNPMFLGFQDHEPQVDPPDSTGLQGILDTPQTPVWWGEYGLNDHYRPMPISPLLITRLARAAPVHESALACKRAAVSTGYQPPKNHALLPTKDLRAAVNDFFHFGNAYFQRLTNSSGEVLKLRHLPARRMRLHQDQRRYVLLVERAKYQPFQPQEVLHLMEHCVESEFYGLPSYLAGIRPMLLRDDLQVFYRRFFRNGAHVGKLIIASGDAMSPADAEKIRATLAETKREGNFKTGLIRLGSEMRVTAVELGDMVKTRFDFLWQGVRNDILNAHMVPPELLSVVQGERMPAGGDLNKKAALFNKIVVRPVQNLFAEVLNEALPKGQGVSFDPFMIEDAQPARNTKEG